MVRHYKRKRADPLTDEEQIRLAVSTVLTAGHTIKGACSLYNVTRATLGRYVKQFRETGAPLTTKPLKRQQHSRQIIPSKLETELAKYLKKCSLMSHGLTPSGTQKKLACQFAVANKFAVPENWIKRGAATEDWFSNFLKRNPSLSIRAPEATSQARSSGFNEPVVAKFYDNLMEVMAKCNIRPGKIWNTDESGCPTVLHRH